MRILAIGNSFSMDATAHLAKLAQTDGEELYVLNLYIGGCSLKRHWENMQADAAEYDEQFHGVSTGKKLSIDQALADGPWDVITLQQASHDSGIYESYEPYLTELAAHVREKAPGAKLWIHQTWAYEIDSTHPEFVRYDHDQNKMYEALTDAYDKAAKAVNAELIPCGRVIQTLRQLPFFDYANGGHSLCRDGFHMDLTYGRYAIAAAWYVCLTGRDVRKNRYVPCEEAQEDVLELIRETVHTICGK